MAESDIMTALRATGALKHGHFVLASGLHSDQYVEKFDLLRRPRATEAVCRGFVEAYRDQAVNVVVGPTTGGVILAFEVARQLGVVAAYAERGSEGGTSREFKRGTTFEPGARVLIVDDILTTGGSIRETLQALAGQSVTVIGIAVLVDRSRGQVDFGLPLTSLATLEIATWSPEECPLCAERVPLVKPGTTAAPESNRPA